MVCLWNSQGAGVAGSGEWGQSGGMVRRAQQHKNCGPHHSSGFMQMVIGSYSVCEQGQERLWSDLGCQGGGWERVYRGLETQGRERLSLGGEDG